MIVEIAYAKINSFLDIVKKREDGFHDIISLMHTISLCDKVKLVVRDGEKKLITLTSNSNEIPLGKDNLVYKAASMYLDKSDICSEINIKIEKNIPIGAGLAGGSADAAATLRALNKIYRALSDAELFSVAEELGSDVPFCLAGGSALCEGRGEKMTAIPSQVRHVVVAIGSERVNTAKAYKALDELYNDFTVPKKGIALDVKRPFDNMYNVFEEIASEDTLKLKSKMLSLLASDALMSGSGPSVFGLFDTKEDAQNAAIHLRGEGYVAYYATTL